MTIRTILVAIPMVLVGWIGVLAVVTLISDGAPGYVALIPSQGFLRNLPEKASILAVSKSTITLASEEADFAHALYQSGAWLVLPAGLPGCLPLP